MNLVYVIIYVSVIIALMMTYKLLTDIVHKEDVTDISVDIILTIFYSLVAGFAYYSTLL